MGSIITTLYSFISFFNYKHEEYQYIGIIDKLLKRGKLRSGRDGVKTLSSFGVQMRFSLRNGTFPLLTTKKMHFKSIVEELLWMIRGSTDSKELESKGVKIWSKNGSRENLDKLGFDYRKEGDLGPIYGFQWRHYGDRYTCSSGFYTGIDQLKKCIEMIKNDPTSRRIIMSAWNPVDIDQMVLPPCHVLYQFYVEDDELSCCLYQRSGDMGLGVPFNIASGSLLTILIAKCCNLKPKEFIHTIGDCHVYQDHIEQLKKQCSRKAYEFPTITVASKTDITDYVFEDITLNNYSSHGPLKMDMTV